MKKSLLALAIGAALVGCGSSNSDVTQTPPQYAQPQYAPQPAAPAPVVVQQAPQDSGMKDMLTGAAIGAIAGNMLSGPRQPAPVPQTRIVQRTVYRDRAPAPVAAPAPAAKPTNYSAYRSPTPAYKPAAKPQPSYSRSYSASPSRSSSTKSYSPYRR